MATSASILRSCSVLQTPKFLIALSIDEMHGVSLHGVEAGLSVMALVPCPLWSAWLPGFMLPNPSLRPQSRENSQGGLQTKWRSRREQCPHHSAWLMF